MIEKINKINRYFGLFLFCHLLIWTLVPTFSNNNLPLDTIEALAWGSNLDWGFEKHPPLSAFFVEIFYQIFGNKDWAYYLLSQLFVILAFFIVWKFSQSFFRKQTYSLISVLLLEGIYFYNYTTPEFNVNICQLPFWALTVYYTWKCIKDDNIKDYLLLGLFIGLGVLSKYLFIYLIIALKIFFIYFIKKEKKVRLKYFISGSIFILVLLPHLIWLIDNNYITITYAFHRTGIEEGDFFDHITHPLIFLGKQIGILIPFFIMLFLILSKFKIKINLKDEKLLFLLIINIIPIFLMFLTSMFMGIKIRTMWMTPFYLFFGVLLVYIFQSRMNLRKLKNFTLVFLILFIFSPFAYSYVSITEKHKRTDYQGKEISELVQNRWEKNFINQITIVVGDEWYGGNLSYHLKSRPRWFNSLDGKLANINVDGGVIYIGNAEIIEKVCPFPIAIFGKIKSHGICMIGSR